MNRDDRLYAFFVAHTSRSRAQIRRICIHKRWLKVAGGALCLVLGAALFGLYGMFREAQHLRVERENLRLRAENRRQRQQLEKLEDRVDAIEDASRRIAEISGVAEEGKQADGASGGAGGPLFVLDEAGAARVEARAAQLERELQEYESALRERARIPSLWPTAGEMSGGFGVRRDPFGGGLSEFHARQDISADYGAPVVTAADGTIRFTGAQGRYGQIVIVEHGNGLTTRYGHLSKIEVTEGQEVKRGQVIGSVGSTGRSTGPHLHYEVRLNEEAVNPRGYLPSGAERSAPVSR